MDRCGAAAAAGDEAAEAAALAAGMRILAASFAYNEGDKIRRTLARHPSPRSYDLLVADDGSTDHSLDGIDASVIVLRSETNRGIGAAMKGVFQYALDHAYDVLVIHAGNDKDEPLEIPLLVEPIVNGRADFVQGSRYLGGGGFGNMPRYRVFSTRVLHPLVFSIAARKRVTESTNGFRAFRTELLRDPRIDWRQDWLDRYELEPYLLLKAIRLGYRHCEVPVTKIYPPHTHGYTKMRPFLDWWSILRPVVYLGLGLKK
jgi:dolichol-phosphate mannosyltransferase